MPIRLIHVGMGNWGQNWEEQVLATMPEHVEVVAHVEPHPPTMAAAKARLGLDDRQNYADLDRALAEVEADVVLATVPVEAHVPVALAALRAGRHVVVEKPFAPTVTEAQTVADLAAETGLTAMVSQNYRFYPAVERARALVASGAMGAVGAVTVDFRRWITPGPTSPYGKIAHPLLEDMAIHHFDLVRYVLGTEAESVTCHAWNPNWSTFAGLPAATAHLAMVGGVGVSYRGNWVSAGPPTAWAGEWRVECERGEIVWTSRADDRGLEAERVVLRPYEGIEVEETLPTPTHWGRAGVMLALAEAVERGVRPACDAADNLHSLALSAAVIEANATRRTVTLGG